MLVTPLNKLWVNTHPNNEFLTILRDKNPRVGTVVFVVETMNSTMWIEPSDGCDRSKSEIFGRASKHRI